MVPPRGIAPRSIGYRPIALLLSYEGMEKWSRAPVLPRVSPRPKRGGLLSSSRVRVKNGGLCGHCSRDLPFDKRLLFVAELTGQWNGGLCR